jgi:hypothetical protein
MLLSLLVLAACIGGLVFFAKKALSNSPFAGYLFMPWGELIEAPSFLAKITGAPKRVSADSEPAKVPASYLALLTNRDRLARPLAASILELAARRYVQFEWRTETEEFILNRLDLQDGAEPSKLDRALLGKLFPNEARELIVNWRNARELGEARRLLERAMMPRVSGSRLALDAKMLAAGLLAGVIAISAIMSSTETGFISIIMPILLLLFPSMLLTLGGLAYKTFQLYRRMPAERFQVRLFILATFAFGIALSSVIMIITTLFAYGLVSGLCIILIACLIPVLSLWLRPAAKLTKGHQTALLLRQELDAMSGRSSNPEEVTAQVPWGALAAAIATGNEYVWADAVTIRTTVEEDDDEPPPVPDEEDLLDDEELPAAAPPAKKKVKVELDYPRIKIPANFKLGGKTIRSSELASLLGVGFWYDLWYALLVDIVFNISREIEFFRNISSGKSKAAQAEE